MTFEARNVRDFTLVGAPDFRTTSGAVDGVRIVVWYRPGFPPRRPSWRRRRRRWAGEAKLLGLPYRTTTSPRPAGGYGMESPGLTWIPPVPAASVPRRP